MNILDNENFIITKEGNDFSSMNINIKNVLRQNDQPAIVGGGKNIMNKNSYGYPIGLVALNQFNKKNLIANTKLDDTTEIKNKVGGVISDDLYSKLLGIEQNIETKNKTAGKRNKKTRHKKTRHKKRKTRKK
tara:strand:- start:26 stop:421 length:396 start_codon:yes stop_codon:yes gene_type:complete